MSRQLHTIGYPHACAARPQATTWVAAPHTHEHQIAWWAHASAALLLATIVWFIMSDLQRWRQGVKPCCEAL